MLSQDKFHKLCKYSLRLEKSFIANDINNYTKYCSHLKHHIGGENTNTKLNDMFDSLIKIIKEKQTDSSGNFVNYETLQNNVKTYEEDNIILSNQYNKLQTENKQLKTENEQLQIKITDFEKTKESNENTINELKTQNNGILAANNELNTKIQKYKAIIDNVNTKLNEIDSGANLNIDNVKYEEELKLVLDQFETKLKTTTTTCDDNKQTIDKNIEQINNLTIENQNLEIKIKELEKRINELEQENQEKVKLLSEKDNILVKKEEEYEQNKQDNIKVMEQTIKDTKTQDIVEFKTKLTEILKTIYGQPLAQAIIEGSKLGDSQPEITISEENKLIKETKLTE